MNFRFQVIQLLGGHAPRRSQGHIRYNPEFGDITTFANMDMTGLERVSFIGKEKEPKASPFKDLRHDILFSTFVLFVFAEDGYFRAIHGASPWA